MARPNMERSMSLPRFALSGFLRPCPWKKRATSARAGEPTRKWPRAGSMALSGKLVSAAPTDAFHRDQCRSIYSAANVLSVGRKREGEGVFRRPYRGDRGSQRGSARVVGLRGAGLAERYPVRLTVAAVAQRSGPCTVRLGAVRDPGRGRETVVRLLAKRDGRRNLRDRPALPRVHRPAKRRLLI